jgi:methylglutaconyl-CoA hydratase
MKSMVSFSYEENLKDSQRLSEMFRLIANCPMPVIARVNGSAMGGGTGLVAVTDIAVASDDCVFGFSEVKLGLAPAVISPYVFRRLGDKNCREYFLTGEKFTAKRACEIGLINYVVAGSQLDETVDDIASKLLSSGPQAMTACKKLLAESLLANDPKSNDNLARTIAKLRIGDEAQEGMQAFLEKRRQKWSN